MKKKSTDALKKAFTSSRGSQLLGAILVFQLLLAGGLYWQSQNEARFPLSGALVAVDAQSIDTLLIESGSIDSGITDTAGNDSDAGQQLVFKRVDEGWQFDDDRELPADGSKVDQLLATLTDLSAGLPVATSTAAQAQLEVAEDAFQRHVILKDGEQIEAELYLGTSPGFRKAHVRKAGDTAIHAAKVNIFDLSTDPDAWLDKQLLSFSDITSIEGDGFLIARVNGQWQIRQPEEFIDSHVVAGDVVDKLVSALQNLRVTGLADVADRTAGDSAESPDELQIVTLKVAMSESPPLTLSLTKPGDEVTVTRSDRAESFAVPVAVFDELQAVDDDTLLVDKPLVGKPAASEATTSQ